MSEHEHATDRVEGAIVAECPEGCDVSVTLEYGDAEDNDILDDLKEIISTCRNCGADMGYVQHEQPEEVLD